MGPKDEEFSNKDELENCLKHRGVMADGAGQAAEILFAKGANISSRLMGISSDQLERLGVPTLLSVELMNKLKELKVMCWLIATLSFSHQR